MCRLICLYFFFSTSFFGFAPFCLVFGIICLTLIGLKVRPCLLKNLLFFFIRLPNYILSWPSTVLKYCIFLTFWTKEMQHRLDFWLTDWNESMFSIHISKFLALAITNLLNNLTSQNLMRNQSSDSYLSIDFVPSKKLICWSKLFVIFFNFKPRSTFGPRSKILMKN